MQNFRVTDQFQLILSQNHEVIQSDETEMFEIGKRWLREKLRSDERAGVAGRRRRRFHSR